MLIRNVRALIADNWIEGVDVAIDNGRIAAIGTGLNGKDNVWNADGLTLLPGIVDLHGDAFERQMMPRPGVHFPIDLALMETDRQLVANGITTAFHGLTCSWEPGLRSTENARQWLAAYDAIRKDLLCDTRVHLRHEIFNVEAEDLISDWLAQGRIGMLGFNDHLPMYLDESDRHGKKAGAAARAGISRETFASFVRQVHDRRNEVQASVERLAEAARRAGVASASHDDETPDMRQRYALLGSRLCEFPLNLETARAAVDSGGQVVMGAPNIVRGGSHADRLGAAQLVREGLCSILTSDYFYPALLQSVFLLDRQGVAPLDEGWALVSANPARAAGLNDRGEIAQGQRADLILTDASHARPSVVATLVSGRVVYLADPGRRLSA
ncbi:MAG: alpha-D-ribose 1-methylphosphonate 5-triphosphate diphosphatase [Rhodospirillales bacterium]|nr:MAG: alpha-D-ribose 1-methylphosphonate 5-triphosphate diphosphatase [Rhodospirillales bacterium]